MNRQLLIVAKSDGVPATNDKSISQLNDTGVHTDVEN